MTLWFIGAGLGGAHSLSEQAKNVITESDVVPLLNNLLAPRELNFSTRLKNSPLVECTL